MNVILLCKEYKDPILGCRRPRPRAGYGATFASLVAGLLLMAGVATASEAQNVILTQTTLLGGFPNGGVYGSGSAAGTSMAVNTAGNVYLGTSYGGSLVQFNGSTGVQTTLGSYSSIGPVAVDPSNNLYIGNVYSQTIVKLPYVSGTYAAFSTPSSSTPVCTGTDTAECTLASSAVNLPYGLTSMAIDSKGNLFYASTNGGSAGDHAIFEIAAASLATTTPTAKMIYQDPANGAGSVLIGGIATDPSGNLFFSDAAFADQSNLNSSASYVNELAYTGTGTTGFSAAKVVLYTYTVAAPANYDNLITSVAVNSSGTTLYFATEYDGVFGFPISKGLVNTAKLYTFATSGAQMMTTDGNGNIYTAAYSNATGGDALTHSAVGILTVPQTNLGSSGTASNIATILNDIAGCGSSTVSFVATQNGATSTEFSAATSGSCSSASLSNASVIPTTVTFYPAASGTRTATITATDASMSSGSATVSAIGVGSPAATPVFSPAGGSFTSIQSVAISDSTANPSLYYTIDGSTPTTGSTLYTGPITVAASETIKAIATAVGSGASAVASATFTITLPAATPTFNPASGTYNAVQSVSIADTTTGAKIYYTTDGSTPTTSSTVYTQPVSVVSTETLNAIAVASGYVTSATGSATYTINLPTFGLAINPNALTVARSGGQALANVIVSPLNTFAGTVTFACSGLPSGATCAFTPSAVVPSGTYPVITVLAITLPTTLAGARNGLGPVVPAAFALALCLLGWRRRRGIRLVLLTIGVAAFLGTLSGCGSTNNPAPKATTSTITVTATSGTVTQTATIALTVQ